MNAALTNAVFYLLLGGLFTYFAIQHINTNGWTFFVYILIFFATVDIGSGLKILFNYFSKEKNQNSES